MKNKRFFLTSLIVAIVTVGLVGTVLAQTTSTSNKTKDALKAAMNDELKAKAMYQAVLDKHGPFMPFKRIIQGEKRHINKLEPLFQKYGVRVPDDNWADRVQAPDTILEACQQGLAAEQENVKMYNEFLTWVQEPDIKKTFTYLRNASERNHIPAFERCITKHDWNKGRHGKGKGKGKGKGGNGKGAKIFVDPWKQ